jgi:amino acid permease
MYLGYKLIKRTRIVRLQDMDLDTDVYGPRKEDVIEEVR